MSIRPEDDDSWSFLVRSAPIRPEDSGQLTFLDRISLGLARSAPRLLRMLNLRDLQLQGPFNRRVVEIVLRFVPTISRLLLSQFFTWNDLRLVLEDYPDKVHIIRPIGNKPVRSCSRYPAALLHHSSCLVPFCSRLPGGSRCAHLRL